MKTTATICSPESTVFIVDDDALVREGLRWLIESAHLPVECYSCAQEFLSHYNGSRPGCLILDLYLPDTCGLDLLAQLRAHGDGLPVIIITAQGDVSAAVKALKTGAVDFLEKPLDCSGLLEHIRRAVEQDASRRRDHALRRSLAARLELLTPREREVLDLLVAGEPSKIIAKGLRIRLKTVEAHRARIMAKLQARNVAHLVRIATTCQLQRAGTAIGEFPALPARARELTVG